MLFCFDLSSSSSTEPFPYILPRDSDSSLAAFGFAPDDAANHVEGEQAILGQRVI